MGTSDTGFSLITCSDLMMSLWDLMVSESGCLRDASRLKPKCYATPSPKKCSGSQPENVVETDM